MKENSINQNLSSGQGGTEDKNYLQGYQGYPASEEIYRNYHSNEHDNVGSSNEIIFINDISVSGLDIPGSKLNGNQEIIGSKDENYSILGEGDYVDLEED
jgi:hypothetical protein